MSWLRILNGLIKLFDPPCEVCGRKKNKFWEHDDFPNKVFCTQRCLNAYAYENNPNKCYQCQERIKGKETIPRDYLELKFCKMACANKYFWKNSKDRCHTCGRGISINYKTLSGQPNGPKFCKSSCGHNYNPRRKQ